MMSSWSPASWTSSTSQSTQAKLPSMTGEPVIGAGCQSMPSNLSPPETAKRRPSSTWWSARTLTQKVPARAIRGQLVERPGRRHRHEGWVDRERDEALAGEAHR